jgi:hypothetical protein
MKNLWNSNQSSVQTLRTYIWEDSKLNDYLRISIAKKIGETLWDENNFKERLAKIFSIQEIEKTDIYSAVRPYFAFARRHIHDLFWSIEWWEELYWPYHNLLFNPDQTLTVYEYAKYALKTLPAELIRYKRNNSKPWELDTLRGIHELYLLFYVAIKYRDYLQTPQAQIMRKRESVKYVLDRIKPHIVDIPESIEIDPNKDNPLFELTNTHRKLWRWDSDLKTYDIRNSDERNSRNWKDIWTEEFYEFDLDSTTIHIWSESVKIAHIWMRDKDAWSLIRKWIRKQSQEHTHTDYTGLKLVLPEDGTDKEKTVNKLFDFFASTLWDGFSWVEQPEKEPLNSNVKKRKDIKVWKWILKWVVNGITYPIEIQIYENETSYLFRDIDPKSPIYHATYKLKQLEELIWEFLPEQIYGNPKLKIPSELRKLNWSTWE